jgi:hypothetical protein
MKCCEYGTWPLVSPPTCVVYLTINFCCTVINSLRLNQTRNVFHSQTHQLIAQKCILWQKKFYGIVPCRRAKGGFLKSQPLAQSASRSLCHLILAARISRFWRMKQFKNQCHERYSHSTSTMLVLSHLYGDSFSF